MGVVVGRGELEDRAELGLGLRPSPQTEGGHPERPADRGLLGLEPLRLLEGHGRLRGHSLLQPPPALLEVVVRVAHRRYGTFSRTRSTTVVRSRVRPISIADTSAPASIAFWKTLASSYGGPPPPSPGGAPLPTSPPGAAARGGGA